MKRTRMMGSVLTVCTMLCGMMAAMPVSASGTTEGTYNGLTYENYENVYIVITDCDTSLTTVEVPAEIDGVEVTEIGNSAFAYCRDLTSVTLPETIIGIMSYAFDSCESLTTIQIPARTGVVADDAFDGCDVLESITVAAGSTAFKSVDGVLMEYDGSTIVRYPAGKADTAYTVPDGVADFGYGAFEDCDNLTEVTLPASFEYFDAHFKYCDYLQSVAVAEGNPNFKSVDGILYSKDGSVLYCYPTDKKGDAFAIPAGTTTLAMSAFYGNMNILSVTAPDSLREIGSSAFYDCMNLQSVTLPDSMDSIGSDAFSFCYDLTDLKLPSRVETMYGWTFCYCQSLTEINLPDNITKINAGMFQGCSGLTSVEIPSAVTSIDMYAFYDCSGMNYVTIPAAVTTICEGAFDGCDALTDVYFAGSEAEWNAVTIESENDPLLNATIHYGAASTTPDTPVSSALGDINRDGAVDAADAARILMAAAAQGSGADSGFTDEQKANADLNSDSVFDSIDASLILQYAAYTGSGGTMSLTDYLASL